MKKSNFIIIAEKFADISVISRIVWIKILVFIFFKIKSKNTNRLEKRLNRNFDLFRKNNFPLLLEREKIIMVRMSHRIEKLCLSIV